MIALSSRKTRSLRTSDSALFILMEGEFILPVMPPNFLKFNAKLNIGIAPRRQAADSVHSASPVDGFSEATAQRGEIAQEAE